MSVGMSELLILLAVVGLPANDAASLLEPAAYLKAHGVELKAERLAELAAVEPTSGKEQMTQLLAIRWLGAHPAEARKADGVLDVLRAVAEGKKGRDPHRFARDHAARALARIEGKPAPAAWTTPAGSLRAGAFSWFPAEATVLGAVDLRRAPGENAPDLDAFSTMLGRLLPERKWKPIYAFVDTVGNLRLDRVAVAFVMDEKTADPRRIWIRFTGAGDMKRLEEFVAQFYPDREERKGAGGESIIVRTKKDEAPAFAFIGKEDLVMAGYKSNKGNHVELVDALLEARAGKAPNATTGPFAAALKQVSEKAQALFVADVPEAIRTDLPGATPLKTIPSRVVLEAQGGKTVSARLLATMKDAEEATATVKTLTQLKADGLRALKDLPADAKVPPGLVDFGRKTLEGLQIEASGDVTKPEVTVAAQVPEAAARKLLDALEGLLKLQAGPPPEPKPPSPPPPKRP
jgi:hypothetical protein